MRYRIICPTMPQYGAVSRICGAAMKVEIDTRAWIEAGLNELATSGVAGVRVEVLAQQLGVTKGGFYRRFKDRRALLDAVLEEWARGRISVIHQQTALAGLTPRDRLKALVKLYTERLSAQGVAIELAIRQWARADQGAAA